MRMLQVAICDDDQLICGQIESMVLRYAARASTKIQTEIYFAGERLLQDMEKGNIYYDLIFLDIEMNGKMNGIDVAKAIREKLGLNFVNIVFVTSHTDYVLSSFEVYPTNFIVKPIKEDKIVEVIERIMELMCVLDTTYAYYSDFEERKIPLKNIMYFKSQGPMIYIHTTSDILSYYGTLKSTYRDLVSVNGKFIRCHRSYLVNYYHIVRRKYDYFELTNKERIPISECKKEAVKNQYSQYGKGSI